MQYPLKNLSFGIISLLQKTCPPMVRDGTGPLRSSLKQLSDEDGMFLEQIILRQEKERIIYPVNEEEYKKCSAVEKLDT
ncbi:MAG: hypothetical protein P9M03_02630 [Candidatus Theseobacter exili]|nr:hypothetical protein [Candidatus Theseobacter exili]